MIKSKDLMKSGLSEKKRTILVYLLIILGLTAISIWAGRGIFKYGVFSTHDGNHHLARSLDAVQTIREGHFPLRWAGSLNYYCGVPIFNFFYPLLYYLVILVNLIIGEVYLSLKLIYLSTFVVGTVAFFLWMEEELKDKVSALAGAILYLFAPYRFSLIFVRGSPEFLAYAIFPLVLYFYALSFNAKTRNRMFGYLLLATLLGALLLISHNFAAMFLLPLILVYLVMKFIQVKKRKVKQYFYYAISYFGMFAISAFFILPVIFEKKYTRIGRADVINYKDHFPTLAQLIRSKWDYFYSSPGTEMDGMSFMLGYAHWLILGIVFVWVVYKLVVSRGKHIKNFVIDNLWIIGFFILSVFSVFMMLPWSIFVWEAFPLIQEIQFSWRLLGVSVLLISALFGFFLSKIKSSWFFWPILLAGVTLAILGNRNHMLPQPATAEQTYLYSDFENKHYHRNTTTTLGDDIINPEAASACYYDTPAVTTNNNDSIDYEVISRGNTYGIININSDINSLEADRIILGLGYFPDVYTIAINGIDVFWDNCNGFVCIKRDNFNDGENQIDWTVKQTKIQKTSNYVSVFSLLLLLGLSLYVIRTKDKNKKN